MRTQKNGLVRRTVTLTDKLVEEINSRVENTGREFSAELRHLLFTGILHDHKPSVRAPTAKQ